MFRKPRDQNTGAVPSVGRAPTPPASSKTKTMPKAASKPKASQPRLSALFSKATGPLQAQTTPSKQQNDSILKFFKKVDSPACYERSLFIDGEIPKDFNGITPNGQLNAQDDLIQAEELRFNEYDSPRKRRRTSSIPSTSALLPESPIQDAASALVKNQEIEHIHEGSRNWDQGHVTRSSESKSGPFAEDSDSDEEIESSVVEPKKEVEEQTSSTKIPLREHSPAGPSRPTLAREATSFAEEDGFDEFEDFDGEEFYENGEEYIERQYMEEQAALEREFEDDDLNIEEVTDLVTKSDAVLTSEPNETTESACPICNASLKGISSQVGFLASCKRHRANRS